MKKHTPFSKGQISIISRHLMNSICRYIIEVSCSACKRINVEVKLSSPKAKFWFVKKGFQNCPADITIKIVHVGKNDEVLPFQGIVDAYKKYTEIEIWDDLPHNEISSSQMEFFISKVTAFYNRT